MFKMNVFCHLFGIGCLTTSMVLAPLPPNNATCKAAPIAWCEADGKQWGEMGTTCHADPRAREPVTCICDNATPEHPAFGGPGLICQVPHGFEQADFGWPSQ